MEQIIALERVNAPRKDPRWKPIRKALREDPVNKKVTKPKLAHNIVEKREARLARMRRYSELIKAGLHVMDMSFVLGVSSTTVTSDLRYGHFEVLPHRYWRVTNLETGEVNYPESRSAVYKMVRLGRNRLVLNDGDLDTTVRNWRVQHGRWYQDGAGNWREPHVPTNTPTKASNLRAQAKGKQIEAIQKCLKLGYSKAEIGDLVGLQPKSVWRIIRENKLTVYPVAHYLGYQLVDRSTHYFISLNEARDKSGIMSLRWKLRMIPRVTENGWRISQGIWVNYDNEWHEVER
ncbi:hypothetical protein [Schleiferilactobacillus perolens]|uniref:Uncharacterized protein n=1 Tax=Schleiferilactobacillus perolens DSM 12744 TaxID=1423792 RepID=A0A0R1MY40_9LACO|nr:hypothetical protein [Schleiferilactobacillus perolens]KRL13040.1 hypothetical protein FD09_GL002580 [Schleiferilactobacillus perolens DSM 12744]